MLLISRVDCFDFLIVIGALISEKVCVFSFFVLIQVITSALTRSNSTLRIVSPLKEIVCFCKKKQILFNRRLF